MTFESFESFDEMITTMHQREDAAMASLLPVQRALLPMRAFYWMRPAPEYDCVIFGYYNLDDMIALEKSLTPQEELAYFSTWVSDCEHKNLVRGYKSGRAYSVIEPTGELGDTHVANMWPITRESFEQARDLGWDVLGKITPGTPLSHDIELMNVYVHQHDAQS